MRSERGKNRLADFALLTALALAYLTWIYVPQNKPSNVNASKGPIMYAELTPKTYKSFTPLEQSLDAVSSSSVSAPRATDTPQVLSGAPTNAAERSEPTRVAGATSQAPSNHSPLRPVVSLTEGLIHTLGI